MAGIIAVSETDRWEVSNWVYWNLLDSVLELVSEASDSAKFVETCKWMQGLDVPAMIKDEPQIATSVLQALKYAAQNCSAGAVSATVEGRVLDQESQRQFREATRTLFAMLSELS